MSFISRAMDYRLLDFYACNWISEERTATVIGWPGSRLFTTYLILYQQTYPLNKTLFEIEVFWPLFYMALSSRSFIKWKWAL